LNALLQSNRNWPGASNCIFAGKLCSLLTAPYPRFYPLLADTAPVQLGELG